MGPNPTELVPLMKKDVGGFLVVAVVKNALVNMGDMSLIPGLGRSDMPSSNGGRVPQQEKAPQ